MSQLTLEHTQIQPMPFRGPGEVCVCVFWGVREAGGGGAAVYLKRPGNFSGLFVETAKVRIRNENAFLCEFKF